MSRYRNHSLEALDHLAHFHESFAGYKNRLTEMWLQIIEQGEGAFKRSNMRGHITATMFVLHPDQKHCLLIDHKHHQLWLPPGGHIEEGTLLDNALREVEEETGLSDVTPIIPHPVHIDTHPITPRPAKGEGAHYHHDMLFLGQAHTSDLTPQEEEVAEARWFPLDEIAQGSGHAAEGARNTIKTLKRLSITA